MIVRFTTDSGARYSIDHKQGRFFQTHPRARDGELWNVPTVRMGHRVAILTPPNGRGDAKLIQTGVVVKRQVELD